MSTLNYRCPLRRKGQRYDKRLLPMLFESHDGTLCGDGFPPTVNDPPFDFTKAALVYVGEFQGFNGYGSTETFEALEIEHDGWVIPAYRVPSPRPLPPNSGSFCICQSYTRKAVRL